jgi:hypothetical protein
MFQSSNIWISFTFPSQGFRAPEANGASQGRGRPSDDGDQAADLLEVCNVFDRDASFQTWIGFAAILGMNHQERNLAWKKAYR